MAMTRELAGDASAADLAAAMNEIQNRHVAARQRTASLAAEEAAAPVALDPAPGGDGSDEPT